LGTQVPHSHHGNFISQQKYVLDLLAETGKLEEQETKSYDEIKCRGRV